jgi:hypothetical protein
MSRFFALSAAVLTLGLLSATGAVAAPKNDGTGPVCEAGIGKAVCCKTFVANHCPYVSCCEKGNAAFFTAKHCSLCDAHVMDHAKHASAQACSPGASGCEAGNSAFFSAANSMYGTRGGQPSCCAVDKK